MASSASVGYYVQVDTSHPPGLHDNTSYFSLAPAQVIVEEKWFGEYKLERTAQSTHLEK